MTAALDEAAARVTHLERVLAYEAEAVEAQTAEVRAIVGVRRERIDAAVTRLRQPLVGDAIADYSFAAVRFGTARSCVRTDRGVGQRDGLEDRIQAEALGLPLGSAGRGELLVAQRRIWDLEHVLAFERGELAGLLSLKAITGSRRAILDRVLDRMGDVAAGGNGDYSHTGRMGTALERLRRSAAAVR